MTSVWGVNISNQIFFKQHGPWERVDGEATQIHGSGNGNHVVAINNSAGQGELYYMAGRHGHWQRLDGSLKHACVTDDGQIWAVNNSDQIFYKANVHSPWEGVGGAAKQICCDSRGHNIVCCNSSEEIYFRTGRHGHWERLDGALKHCTVSNDAQFWGANSADQIYYKAHAHAPWEQVGGSAKQIHVSPCGQQIICVNSSQEIYRMQGGRHGRWERDDGALVHCTISSGVCKRESCLPPGALCNQ